MVGSEEGHNKAELMNLTSRTWQVTESYPYASKISLAMTVNLRNNFILFGGEREKPIYASADIALFTTESETWTKIGQLQTRRQGHGVIDLGDHFLVVGGINYDEESSSVEDDLPTEKCKLDENDNMKCSSIDPVLNFYVQYPELFVVPENYCE